MNDTSYMNDENDKDSKDDEYGEYSLSETSVVFFTKHS